MNTPTPETVLKLERERNVAIEQWELCIDLAKKNENERDEARKEAEYYKERYEQLKDERDELLAKLSTSQTQTQNNQ